MTNTRASAGSGACKKAVLTSPSSTFHLRSNASRRSTRAPTQVGVAAYVSWTDLSLPRRSTTSRSRT
eukprot:8876573-Heterocapsa_arctica.AAC.1